MSTDLESLKAEIEQEEEEEDDFQDAEEDLDESIEQYTARPDPPVEVTLQSPKGDLREKLPSPRPKTSSGIYSVLKSAIGKDITRISMPVHFNEPLSFLQRLVEDLENSYLLDQAAESTDSLERLELVAAFGNAMFASLATGHRGYKSFNPLLGETFEYIRPDLGYRVICEQVSHHPPITALHAESTKGWVFRQDYHADVKFRGNLKITPTGVCIVEFPKFQDVFTWTKSATTVHNIFLGKLWLDQSNIVEVKNHRTNEKCRVLFRPYSEAGKKYFDLSAHVYDSQGQVQHTLHGRWDKGLVCMKSHVHVGKLPDSNKLLDAPGDHQVLWKANEPSKHASSMYGMTDFSMTLNQVEENICPTDCRHRPDQRLLEDGKFEEASAEKHRLEEKQREKRKIRKENDETWHPRWFKSIHDPKLDVHLHIYTGGYWDSKQKGQFSDLDKFDDLY